MERAFSLALLVSDEFGFEPHDADRFIDPSGLLLAQKVKIRVGSRSFVTDFAFPMTRLCIEIDGAVFHDIPEQVQHDRERDRLLMSAGWRTIRFGQTEIAAHALDCAREAVILARLDGRPRAEQLHLVLTA